MNEARHWLLSGVEVGKYALLLTGLFYYIKQRYLKVCNHW